MASNAIGQQKISRINHRRKVISARLDGWYAKRGGWFPESKAKGADYSAPFAVLEASAGAGSSQGAFIGFAAERARHLRDEGEGARNLVDAQAFRGRRRAEPYR